MNLDCGRLQALLRQVGCTAVGEDSQRRLLAEDFQARGQCGQFQRFPSRRKGACFASHPVIVSSFVKVMAEPALRGQSMAQ